MSFGRQSSLNKNEELRRNIQEQQDLYSADANSGVGHKDEFMPHEVTVPSDESSDEGRFTTDDETNSLHAVEPEGDKQEPSVHGDPEPWQVVPNKKMSKLILCRRIGNRRCP